MELNLMDDVKRSYPLEKYITTQEIAYALAEYLDVEKNMITQVVRNHNTYLIQCKGDASAEWTKFLGLNAALSVHLSVDKDYLNVSIGFDQWIEKLGIAAIGAVFFQPLLLTSGIGFIRQMTLPNDILHFIEGYLYPDGNVPETAGRSYTEYDEETCPECGAKIRKGDVFCSSCGVKLVEEKKETVCPECGEVLNGDEIFCPKCGHHLKED